MTTNSPADQPTAPHQEQPIPELPEDIVAIQLARNPSMSRRDAEVDAMRIMQLFTRRTGQAIARMEGLYKPELTDLEANNYHGKERPVVYLEDVIALLRDVAEGSGGESDG